MDALPKSLRVPGRGGFLTVLVEGCPEDLEGAPPIGVGGRPRSAALSAQIWCEVLVSQWRFVLDSSCRSGGASSQVAAVGQALFGRRPGALAEGQ